MALMLQEEVRLAQRLNMLTDDVRVGGRQYKPPMILAFATIREELIHRA
jgi:hypothetical protein